MSICAAEINALSVVSASHSDNDVMPVVCTELDFSGYFLTLFLLQQNYELLIFQLKSRKCKWVIFI